MQGARLEVAQRTDPGRDPAKQVNEDSAGQKLTRLGHLLVVCDGMGGHALGREASQLAVATILRMVDNAPEGTTPGSALVTAVVQAGRVVHELGASGPMAGRPGSTCVALLVHSTGTEVAHVGDSRAYFLRKGNIWQITKDHSVVQQMIDQGALTPEQASVHPEANKITRALGMKPETDVELRDPPILHAAGDIFLLASDGLCDLVRTDEIASVIAAHPGKLERACEELVRMANDRGGHDNITVQIARVLPGAGAPATVTEPQQRAAPLAPTLVETPGAAGPEPTLVDQSLAAPTPAAPAARVAKAPAVATPKATVPLSRPAVPPSTASSPVAAPPAGTPTVPPGPPSRSGAFVMMATLVALILLGVVAWWVFYLVP
jgi:PPM family protein phosphatase